MTATGTRTQRSSVVIVENDPGFSATLETRINEVLPDCDVHRLDITASPAEVRQRCPAVVVLDWFADTILQEPAGQLHWDDIWREWFTPIVVVSAGDIQAIKEGRQTHPLVEYVPKGRNAIDEVANRVREFLPGGQMILAARDELTSAAKVAANAAITKTVPLIWPSLTDDRERAAVLRRVVQRQLAAIIYDESMRSTALLLPWEQYIVPPTASHLMTGDIVRKKDAKPDPDCDDFRLVVSPSCDLAQTNIKEVLLARCKPMKELENVPPLRDAPDRDEKKRLWPMVLTQAQTSARAPLPEFPKLFPNMVALLRRLELAPIASVALAPPGQPQHDLVRVASTSSPFREQLAWAYLQVSCRPGVPDRDFGPIIDEMLEA